MKQFRTVENHKIYSNYFNEEFVQVCLCVCVCVLLWSKYEDIYRGGTIRATGLEKKCKADFCHR